ncbi:MAG: crotonase/enoyl-CoA hydratase family protein [Alphaproteobacteria bacterium]|nr:crotonase/enoyl-CoA hydratase family protein [Alphaproteobacteria bacterium]MDE1968980.1 crotonase/enoyl-CoA hydratase family protein [Alphaproteobacteria bacterium]MDE2513277.1 crotonase/enoyl-CoA hydratase family protein [Alphaproteobacteria bacterium]
MTTVTQLADLVQDRLAAARGADIEHLPDPVEAAIAGQRFREFELEYDRTKKILFCYFKYAGRPCFTPALLREAQAIQRLVRGLFGDRVVGEPPLRYLVLASRTPQIWNLGGDLELFSTLIRNRDRAALRRYAHSCCEIGFTNATGLGFDLPVISVALVQGDALGGGFEAVLSSNLIVAERGAKFGLPEILFNLFPGMGAYSFLARRIAPGIAERLIMSGEIYSAEQLHALGVVDVLAADGQGMQAFYDFIGRRERRYAAQRAMYRARRLVNPVTFEEMTRIADLWVEAAFKLEESDLKRMERLVTAQERRGVRA